VDQHLPPEQRQLTLALCLIIQPLPFFFLSFSNLGLHLQPFPP
jgi:hypothetical protein